MRSQANEPYENNLEKILELEDIGESEALEDYEGQEKNVQAKQEREMVTWVLTGEVKLPIEHTYLRAVGYINETPYRQVTLLRRRTEDLPWVSFYRRISFASGYLSLKVPYSWDVELLDVPMTPEEPAIVLARYVFLVNEAAKRNAARERERNVNIDKFRNLHFKPA